MRRITAAALFCVALSTPACDQDRAIKGPQADNAQAGYFGAVLFPGFVTGSEPRFGLNTEQAIDLVAGAQNSKAQSNASGAVHRYQFGKEGALAEISWKHITSKSAGDIYEFTLRRPLGEPGEEVLKAEVAYTGQKLIVFEYAGHAFAIEPQPSAD